MEKKSVKEVIKTEGLNGFFKRWKQGIAEATPEQQTQVQITFTWITLIGIAFGFIVSIYNAKNLWWLAIVLGGAFGNTFISLIALKQKLKLLNQFKVQLEGMQEEVIENE